MTAAAISVGDFSLGDIRAILACPGYALRLPVR